MIRFAVTSVALAIVVALSAILWLLYGGARPDAAAEVRAMIGTTTLSIPAAMIRFPAERRDGLATRIDLMLAWPGLTPVDDRTAATLDATEEVDPLVFVTLSARGSGADTTERLDLVYSRVFSDDAWAGPAGLVGVALSAEAGYAGEELYFEPEGDDPFVTRCLAPSESAVGKTCMREIHIGDVAVLYRFDRSMLPNWSELEDAVRAKLESFGAR